MTPSNTMPCPQHENINSFYQYVFFFLFHIKSISAAIVPFILQFQFLHVIFLRGMMIFLLFILKRIVLKILAILKGSLCLRNYLLFCASFSNSNIALSTIGYGQIVPFLSIRILFVSLLRSIPNHSRYSYLCKLSYTVVYADISGNICSLRTSLSAQLFHISLFF